MKSDIQYKPFSQIVGQDKAIRFLKGVIARGKIPHAYMFTGISGIGKTTTALAFTQAINCLEPVEQEGCGKCRICRQIRNGNFADLIYIEPDGQNIKIEQIRELNRSLNYKPVTGRYRVSIIQQAEVMTEEAANSFLKTLEEPPPGNILILKVIEPRNLLPTIVSRCQKIPFHPIPFRLIEAWLKEEIGVDDENAPLIARLSAGSLGRAIHIAEGDFLDERQNHLLRVMHLPTMSKDQLLDMAVEYSGRSKKRTQTDLDLSEVIDIWKTWYRDMILIKADCPGDLLINMDFSRKLRNISDKFNMEDLIESFRIVDRTQRDLLRNPNAGLMMEDMVLRLSGLYRSSQ